MRLKNTNFVGNSAGSNTIQLMYVYNMSIEGCTFQNNIATTLSKNIFIGFSNISITSTLFQDYDL